jgi:hypothetical protein
MMAVTSAVVASAPWAVVGQCVRDGLTVNYAMLQPVD